MTRRILPLLLLCFTLTAIGCSDAENNADGEADDIGELAPGPGDAPEGEAEPTVDMSGPTVTHKVVMTTDKGDITLGLYGNDAPKAVENFVGLAEKGFYDSIRFHRVVRDFVIQAGDPASKDEAKRDMWGQGGESIFGGTFEDELNPNSPSGQIGYKQGTLAMANRGPNTNTSQFFIVLTDNGGIGLQYAYTIFGTVLDGFDVVKQIEKTAEVPVEGAQAGEPPTAWVQMPPEPATILGTTVEVVEN